jgi:hypothetical protein
MMTYVRGTETLYVQMWDVLNMGSLGGGETTDRPAWRWQKKEWNLKKSNVGCIYLASNKVQWRDILDTIISLPVTWLTVGYVGG